MSSKNKYPAKVIEVIDEHTLVINIGQTNGIDKGKRFLIYHLDKELFDPDSGESLGVLEIVRGTGKVVHVQEKMATIKSDKTISNQVTRRISSLASFFEPTTTESRLKEMPFEHANVGDLAKPI
jgi:hypothetical protein